MMADGGNVDARASKIDAIHLSGCKKSLRSSSSSFLTTIKKKNQGSVLISRCNIWSILDSFDHVPHTWHLYYGTWGLEIMIQTLADAKRTQAIELIYQNGAIDSEIVFILKKFSVH